MSRPAQLHGLSWPEGDPDALRGTADRMAGLGEALEGVGGQTEDVASWVDWSGRGAGSFTLVTGRQAAMLRSHAADLRGGAGALNSLSVMLESAQRQVDRAAVKLGEAKDEAREAARAAERAAEVARDARAAATASLVPALGGLDPFLRTAEAAEADAAQAARRSEAAAERLAEVERWARRVAEEANEDVRRADRAVAGQIDRLGETFGVSMGGPLGSPASAGGGAVPISALGALGRFLGGVGGRSAVAGVLVGGEGRLPVAGGGGGPEQLRALSLVALAGDGLRQGVVVRNRNFARAGAGAFGGPVRLVDPRDLPPGARGAFNNPALRAGSRLGLPVIGLGAGGLLDYMNNRAEGDSQGRTARKAAVTTAGGAAGTFAGGVICGAIGTGSGGVGYATCPILVPGVAWIGTEGGRYLNDLIDRF